MIAYVTLGIINGNVNVDFHHGDKEKPLIRVTMDAKQAMTLVEKLERMADMIDAEPEGDR